ncbi:MAG: hypothetical protein ABSG53_14875 [Thermoguttaceae bacterium]|jgi:hypothetical protein
MLAYRVLAAAAVLFSGSTLVAEAARAADFRVENAVFSEGQSQPQSQGVTIFHEGVVFDFLNEPAEVIVFDKAHRRFILLDIGRKVRSEISIDDVQGFVNRVKQRLSGHPSSSSKWLADPSFEESFDRGNAEVTLKSPLITYQAQVQATAPEVATQYHEFSDWYAQFNFALNSQSRPPFPRMMLNDAIERCQGIAKEVHLSAASSPKDAPVKITSRHQLSTKLDSADMKRVAETREHLRSFRSISFREYRQGK